jgi:hypothetical protein
MIVKCASTLSPIVKPKDIPELFWAGVALLYSDIEHELLAALELLEVHFVKDKTKINSNSSSYHNMDCLRLRKLVKLLIESIQLSHGLQFRLPAILQEVKSQLQSRHRRGFLLFEVISQLFSRSSYHFSFFPFFFSFFPFFFSFFLSYCCVLFLVVSLLLLVLIPGIDISCH